MLTSINISYLYYIGDAKKQIKMLKDAGFEAYDFSFDPYMDHKIDTLIVNDNYIEKAKELRRYADEIGIVCNQAHAPFRIIPKPNDNETKENRIKMIIRSFECASILGAKGIVLHPINEATVDENVKILNEFKEYAIKYNLVILIENMWCWSNELDTATSAACSTPKYFNELLDKLDNRYFKALLDVGHAEMLFREANMVTMIHGLGDRLFGLHIHDNDRHRDLHRIPGENKINFAEMIKALKDINYKGDITLEVMDWFGMYKKDMYNNLNRAAQIAGQMKKALH